MPNVWHATIPRSDRMLCSSVSWSVTVCLWSTGNAFYTFLCGEPSLLVAANEEQWSHSFLVTGSLGTSGIWHGTSFEEAEWRDSVEYVVGRLEG